MLRAKFTDEGTDFAHLIRVEPHSGFIEDDYIGIMNDGLRNSDTLLITFRQRANKTFTGIVQPTTLYDLIHNKMDFFVADPMQPRGELQVFVCQLLIPGRVGGISGR